MCAIVGIIEIPKTPLLWLVLGKTGCKKENKSVDLGRKTFIGELILKQKNNSPFHKGIQGKWGHKEFLPYQGLEHLIPWSLYLIILQSIYPLLRLGIHTKNNSGEIVNKAWGKKANGILVRDIKGLNQKGIYSATIIHIQAAQWNS